MADISITEPLYPESVVLELRARIAQIEQDNEQLRLSLQASAFVQEREKVEWLEAELRAVNIDNSILRERNSELRKGNSAEVERLTAENAGLKSEKAEWLKANGPGGWIDQLRVENAGLREALQDSLECNDNGRHCDVCHTNMRAALAPLIAELQRRIDAGEQFPQFFASTEY